MGSISAHSESICRGDMRWPWQRSWGYPMKRRLEMELDFVTDLSPLELASKITPVVREAIETMKQTLGSELEFDIFLVLDGQEVRLVMESVWHTVIFYFTFYWQRGEVKCYTFHQIIFSQRGIGKQKPINPYSHWVLSDNLCTPNVTPV